MSVKIRKKKEQRNTPIWNFVGVVFIPLLLTFLGGFSLGKTSFIDSQDYKTKYELELAKYNTIQKSLENKEALYSQLDDLKEKVEEGFNELQEKLINAYRMDDDILVEQWDIDKNKEFKKWRNEIANLEVDYDNEKDSLNFSNLRAIKQMSDFIESKQIIINKIQLNKAAKKDNNVINNLQDAGDALSQQIDGLEADVAKKELQLLSKDIEIKGLMNELKLAAAAAGGGGGGTPPDNSAKNIKTAGEIVSKIQTLNQQIDTKMKAKFLGGKGKINSFKATLKTELGNISQLASTIE